MTIEFENGKPVLSGDGHDPKVDLLNCVKMYRAGIQGMLTKSERRLVDEIPANQSIMRTVVERLFDVPANRRGK